MLFLSCDTDLLVLVKLIKTVLWYITIIVPIVLIVIGTFDLFKAVTASKEDEIKAAQKLLVKRIIYAVLIFLIVPIISLVFGLFGKANVSTDYDATWKDYWNYKSTSSQCYGL